jgi:hypothetical protein
MPSRTPFTAALVAALALTFAAPAQACPGCGPPTGQTLASEVAEADMILYGTLGNAKQNPNNLKGTTDVTIETVVKAHDLVKGKKVFTIPRFIPEDQKPTKYMLFIKVTNGDVDAYRGVAVTPESKLPEYVKGAVAARQKDTVSRLRFFFDNLESDDFEISSDAYNEFAFAEYKEVRQLAPTLPADALMKWLANKDTRATRLGLYGLLLGHSDKNKAEGAKTLRALLDDPDRKFSSGLDGVLMGYLMLDKKAGYEYVMKLLADPKKEFFVKHSGLKVLRFFHEFRPDVLTDKEIRDGLTVLLDQPEIADMPIDDLRKWKAWDMTDAVVKLADRESHSSLPIVRRAILKFALAASWADPKTNAAAVAYVEKLRKSDPDRVKQVEDVLREDLKPLTPAPDAKK